MTLLVGLYVAFLVLIGAGSVRSSARKHSWSATVLELITSIGWPILVMAYFWPRVGRVMRPGALPLFIVATGWTCYTLWRDFRPSVVKAQMPQDLPARQRDVAYSLNVVMCALVVVPVVLLGATVAARSLAPAG